MPSVVLPLPAAFARASAISADSDASNPNCFNAEPAMPAASAIPRLPAVASDNTPLIDSSTSLAFNPDLPSSTIAPPTSAPVNTVEPPNSIAFSFNWSMLSAAPATNV